MRNVAWAPGNYKGYDMVATAGQDGFVQVFRIDTPYGEDGGKSYTVEDVTGRRKPPGDNGNGGAQASGSNNNINNNTHYRTSSQALSGTRVKLDKSGTHGERTATGQPEQVEHRLTKLLKLDAH